MTALNFSLSPEATAHVYELLVCLAKFGETVALEARNEKARIALPPGCISNLMQI